MLISLTNLQLTVTYCKTSFITVASDQIVISTMLSLSKSNQTYLTTAMMLPFDTWMINSVIRKDIVPLTMAILSLIKQTPPK